MSDVVPARPNRGEEIHADRPDTPEVGRWYWVASSKEGGDRRLACVTRLGSNYVKLTYVEGETSIRVHHDHFWSRCEFVEDPQTLLLSNADRCKRELDGLLEDVKLLTTKLGVASSLSLGVGAGEAAATSLALASSAPADEYKAALVKAKEETLPELFSQIKEKSREYGQWLGAQVIPMKAEAKKLEPAIKRVEDRIFSVELYAGLCEEVELVKDGEPATLTEPVHLFQRRLYMDEECLANYDTGGMEFRHLRQFERWLCRKDNLERIMPFPRTVVAFQVRHKEKEREIAGFRDFIQMLNDKPLDKLTFLYIKNGKRVYRLSTKLDFGEKLFPDADHPVLTAGEGRLYTKLSSFGDGPKFIGEAEYDAMVASEKREWEEYERRCEEERKKPMGEREYISNPRHTINSSRDYEPFTKDNVHYDDIARQLAREMERHNRVVLILQGLLDRSPALHPHPPWRLHDPGGFAQALRLHRDMDRVLSPGDKPDFEAYRARLNASIGPGTVTIGQEDAWERFEAKKEGARRDGSYRWRRSEYRPEKYRPEGDPGPGRFARVVRKDKKGHVHYRWQKERKGGGLPVGRKYGCKVSRVLNVDAYQPGDYKQFYTDPRTREEYLQWAPLLLAAEEYKAGRHGEAPPIAEPAKRAPGPARTGAADRMRMMRSFLGKAVRLRGPLSTTGGKRYEKESLWRVTYLARARFTIKGILENGEDDSSDDWRSVRNVSHRDFYIDSAVPSDPKYEFKPTKRKAPPVVDEEDDG